MSRRRLMMGQRHGAGSVMCLTFHSDGPQAIYLNNVGGNNPNVEYSINRVSWQTLGTSPVTFNGDIHIRGNNPNGFTHSTTQYTSFAFSYSTAVHITAGDVMKLIDYTQDLDTVPNDYCFGCLFRNATALKTVHGGLLPAEYLTYWCYWRLFSDSGLQNIPEGLLPSQHLAIQGYHMMFQACLSLTSIPEGLFPARNLVQQCYTGMFGNCSNIRTIPTNLLPATTLAQECYGSMFNRCGIINVSNLKLPAPEFAQWCYRYMFQNSSVEEGPQILGNSNATEELKASFSGCVNLRWIKCLDEDPLSGGYNTYVSWMQGVAAAGVFVQHINAIWGRGMNGIPSGWTIVYYDPTTQKHYLDKNKTQECDDHGNII